MKIFNFLLIFKSSCVHTLHLKNNTRRLWQHLPRLRKGTIFLCFPAAPNLPSELHNQFSTQEKKPPLPCAVPSAPPGRSHAAMPQGDVH